MQQLQLRESELGRRYTALGNFSKSADLRSLFTVNCGGFEIGHIKVDGVPNLAIAEVLDCPDLLSMWHRLNALACQPMREIGLGTLQASAASKPAAARRLRSGPKLPANATPTTNAVDRKLPESKRWSDRLRRALKLGA